MATHVHERTPRHERIVGRAEARQGRKTETQIDEEIGAATATPRTAADETGGPTPQDESAAAHEPGRCVNEVAQGQDARDRVRGRGEMNAVVRGPDMTGQIEAVLVAGLAPAREQGRPYAREAGQEMDAMIVPGGTGLARERGLIDWMTAALALEESAVVTVAARGTVDAQWQIDIITTIRGKLDRQLAVVVATGSATVTEIGIAAGIEMIHQMPKTGLVSDEAALDHGFALRLSRGRSSRSESWRRSRSVRRRPRRILLHRRMLGQRDCQFRALMIREETVSNDD